MPKVRISETEWKVMQVLWEKSPIYSRDISLKLTNTEWSEATVKTLINRLVGKGAVGYQKVGKSYEYYPLLSEKQCIQAESTRFINKIFNGSRKEFLAAFVQDAKLTSEEISELRKLLDQKENK